MIPKIKVETSWDDGNFNDLRIADLLTQYRLPGMFYIPIDYPQYHNLTQNEVRTIAKRFDIGAHTIDHYSLREISSDLARSEINGCKQMLETIIGREVSSFCYPRGRYNDLVKTMVREAGFTEARTTKVLSTAFAYDAYEKPTTIHVYPRKEYWGKPIVQIAYEKINEVAKNGGRFHLWGHSWEINQLGLWRDLELIFDYMHHRLIQHNK